MFKRKTVKLWLRSLPEPERTQALSYDIRNQFSKFKATDMLDALLTAHAVTDRSLFISLYRTEKLKSIAYAA
jgi:hypothetical protein